jgi:hypothetical protein
MMQHKLVMTRQVRDWLVELRGGDPVTRRLVAQAINQLLDEVLSSADRWRTESPDRDYTT